MFENPCFGGYMNTLNENKKKHITVIKKSISFFICSQCLVRCVQVTTNINMKAIFYGRCFIEKAFFYV